MVCGKPKGALQSSFIFLFMMGGMFRCMAHIAKNTICPSISQLHPSLYDRYPHSSFQKHTHTPLASSAVSDSDIWIRPTL